LSNRDRILVVDEISDTADVLQAVLEPRGVTVNRVRRWCETTCPADENRPAVVVLDAESVPGAGTPTAGDWQNVPQVIIGMIRPVAPSPDAASRPGVQRRYLQKPFQFAELIQAIESLISQRR
jgi:DNA-binding response OmpR family regulator